MWDGLLEAWEMKDLDLNADTVILSACDTWPFASSGLWTNADR